MKVKVYWDHSEDTNHTYYNAEHIQYVWKNNKWNEIKIKKKITPLMFGVGYGLIEVPYTIKNQPDIKSFLIKQTQKLNKTGLLRISGRKELFGMTLIPFKLKDLQDKCSHADCWLEDLNVDKILEYYNNFWNRKS